MTAKKLAEKIARAIAANIQIESRLLTPRPSTYVYTDPLVAILEEAFPGEVETWWNSERDRVEEEEGKNDVAS